MDETNATNPQATIDLSDPGRALRVAAINGDLDTAQTVLETLPDLGGPDMCDGQGYTPLMLAAKYGHLALVRLLCERGADPNRRNTLGRTALNFTDDPTILFALLEQGGRITTELLESALHSDDEDLLRTLLDRCDSGADSYRLDGPALLTVAVTTRKDNERFVRVLLERGADVNRPAASNGFTPLMQAAQWRKMGCLRLLLDAGADVNAATTGDQRIGKTALMFAAEGQRDAVVNLLLERGADVNAVDEHGVTPLLYAAANDYPPHYSFLSSSTRPFPRPFPQQDPAVEASLTEEDRNALGALGALMSVTGTPGEHLVYSLLEQGANAKASDEWGGTALHRTFSPACTHWLLAAGADREARNDAGWTPVLSAASDGRLDTLKTLVQAEADVHAVSTRSGENALALALNAYDHATNPSVQRDYPDPDKATCLQATIDWLRQTGVKRASHHDGHQSIVNAAFTGPRPCTVGVCD